VGDPLRFDSVLLASRGRGEQDTRSFESIKTSLCRGCYYTWPSGLVACGAVLLDGSRQKYLHSLVGWQGRGCGGWLIKEYMSRDV
jgi:hypothetical protein